MAVLRVFNFLTLNGFFKGPKGDITWHEHGGEEAEFSIQKSQSENILLFGRVTYQLMANWWPTAWAQEAMPELSENMNKAEKIVFSKTLTKATWNNTRIIKTKVFEEVKKLKLTSKKDLTILGSGSIVTQLAEKGLIDKFQFMIDPIAIGKGTPLFDGLKHQLNLKLTDSKVFKSGIVLLSYEPV